MLTLLISLCIWTASQVAAEEAGTLSLSAFTTLRQPLYPRHSVRVKKTKHCDGEVNTYSGYVDIEAKHLWFEFFESRSHPAKDDIVFWTNGGPGCASAVGLYMEHGPCLILDEDGPKRNPYSWNERANVLYIHQPVNVGFSYAEHGETVGTTEDAALDIAAFVSILFDSEAFAHLNLAQPGRKLHMTGESYGGRYVLLFASAILDQNAHRLQNGREPINVASIAIGNAHIDRSALMTGYYDMQCTAVSGIMPVTSISSCVRMKQAVRSCRGTPPRPPCMDIFDSMDCSAAYDYCTSELTMEYTSKGRHFYDITKQCEPSEEEPSCYGSVMKYMIRYLSLNSTQEELGIDHAVRGRFRLCSESTSKLFHQSDDFLRGSEGHVSALLERGVRIISYNGDYDFVVNWPGTQRWTDTLDWSRAEEYRATTLSAWEVDNAPAGMWRGAGGLTFATVHAAGHMPPFDKPKASLALFQRWIEHGTLLDPGRA